MTEAKSSLKFKRPRLIHFVIALLLALLIVDHGAAYLYGPKSGSKDIILYTTSWCPYCESLRTYLKGYNIPYMERDVEKSLAGALGMWALRGRGVPVSVLGETVVYGYDLEKINRALRELGYPIQGPGDTSDVNYLSAVAPEGADTTAQAAAESVCAQAEEFGAFYAKFKADEAFRIQRTRFPLRKRLLSGSHPYRTTDEIAEIERNQVLTKQELVYLDHEIIEVGGYTEHINGGGEESRVEVRPPEGLEPLTIHKFHKVAGCWYLTEFVSYEYFGSLMILSSL